MKQYTVLMIVGGFMLAQQVLAQPCLPADTARIGRLQRDVFYLADDKLEGRAPGTQGEALAKAYIADRFAALGLSPVGVNNTYFQPFTVQDPVRVHAATRLQIKGTTLVQGVDFYPLAVSANATLKKAPIVDAGYGIEAPELGYSDYKAEVSYAGKICLMNYSSPDGVHPHSRYAAYHDLGKRVQAAVAKGAVGVIVYNADPNLPDPAQQYRSLTPSPIPVVFVTSKHQPLLATLPVVRQLTVLQEEVVREAHNVLGLIDRGAARTVIIGAHYDHLGYGEDGSRYRGTPAIHNGADDNASGTAAILELARYLKEHPELKGYNYLLMAFSAEERGLLGSKYFTSHPLLALDQVNYMINLDMVGRLSDTKQLFINGAGTSPVWKDLIAGLDCVGITAKTSESGVGPSDHTSFYLKDIPVLHFFTGSHTDYHTPTDDADKVNYPGTADVVSYLAAVITALDAAPRLGFTKTQDADQTSRPRFSVTMGIMPDYVFEGPGVRIDAVTDGKPASIAGLQAGDVLLSLGDWPIADVQGYMQTLGRFKKGDKTTARVKRANEELSLEVTF
ncbi:MAG: M28 family peptidase [Bacteroidia bacterium]|nr:M28 family peptidase [Bacteroidia bacterium]